MVNTSEDENYETFRIIFLFSLIATLISIIFVSFFTICRKFERPQNDFPTITYNQVKTDAIGEDEEDEIM